MDENPIARFNPRYGPIILRTPTTPIHWGEKLVSGYIVGKLSFGSTTVNKFGQLVPRPSSLTGRVSVYIALMQPLEMGCAELDCNEDGVADYLQREGPDRCFVSGAGISPLFPE